jgi:ABC-2 type transport system ATP-binding protein
MKELAVKTEQLTKKFGELEAVKELNLKIPYGSIYGLIGPDGAGKSTTMRMLAGILTPDNGEAFICGDSSVKDHGKVKDSIAYMSQKFGLYQDLTVYENIKFYADLYGVKKSGLKDRINELLDFSYMRPFKGRLAGNLSGGMKQKLQLVCALIHKPKVLLLDEPTNGVDPVSRRDFWRILYDLVKDGVTIVVSTAYLDEAERCSSIGLMHQGEIISEGSPKQVIENSALSIISIASVNGIEDSKKIKKLIKGANAHPHGNRVRMLSSDTERDKKILSEHFSDLQIEKPFLEDIFMSLQKDSSDSDDLLKLVSEGIDKKSGDSVVVRNITKKFGNFTAVNDISLNVPYGEIFGFLGPNGAGKSTTIRMLCGLLQPTSGSGSVSGFDIIKQPELIKLNIGYMSQKFSLYEDLKVYENIDFYGGIYGLSGKRLQARREWALELSGLTDRKNEPTSNLAGGWRQRLALACSILHSPSIVFLDEPTSGADPASRRLFWDIINELASSGVTVFVSTHYMEEAEYCDRLAMIFRGNMIAMGTTHELKNNLRDKIINVSVTKPQNYLKELSNLPTVNDAALFGAGLHLRAGNPKETINEVSEKLNDMGVKDCDVYEIKPSMEDVFVSLIDEHDGEKKNV